MAPAIGMAPRSGSSHDDASDPFARVCLLSTFHVFPAESEAPRLSPRSELVQGVAMSTSAVTPFRSFAPSYKRPYSPSPLRALVSSEYSNKHHHHHHRNGKGVAPRRETPTGEKEPQGRGGGRQGLHCGEANPNQRRGEKTKPHQRLEGTSGQRPSADSQC